MSALFRLLLAEAIKLRRSPLLRLVLLAPLCYLLLDYWLFGHALLGIRSLTPEGRQLLGTLPVKSLALLWVGFFFPLLVALAPGLLFRPEHRFGMWRHLRCMPAPAWMLFLAKGLVLLALVGLMLGLLGFGLWVEYGFIGSLNAAVAFDFPWRSVAKVMGWMFLGSLPILALYLWLSDRISHGAIPIVFGLVGLLLTIALTGAEPYTAWRRDLIPWVLPYYCAQQAIDEPQARQSVHAAGVSLVRERDISKLPRGAYEFTLPSGRKAKGYMNLPDALFLPPPPTPRWLLVSFSLGAALVLVGLGIVDSRRCRVG